MKRLPIALTLTLLVAWLLLTGSVSVANIVLGSIISILLVLSAAQLRPVRPHLHRLAPIAPLIATVLIDIVHSNFSVACIVLGFVRRDQIRSGFVDVPLELVDPHGLSMLAAIVTATPGTSWVDLSASTLTLHVLNIKDEGQLIQTIKHRYENPLRRIFE